MKTSAALEVPASRHRKQDVPLRGAPSDADESVHPCSVRCFIGERARSGSPAENHGSSRVVNTTPGSIPRSARRVNLVHVRHAAAGAFGRRRARSRRSACVRRRNRRTGEFSPNCELSDASSPLGSPAQHLANRRFCGNIAHPQDRARRLRAWRTGGQHGPTDLQTYSSHRRTGRTYFQKRPGSK